MEMFQRLAQQCAAVMLEQEFFRLGKAYYALATAHAALGTLTEIAALYILLAAGTEVLAPKLRITDYKLCMRSVLVLWWLELVLGLATYIRWYVPRS